MKLFSWVQNKFNGKQENNKQNISRPPKLESKEEFSDWPQSFLSIGTFGTKDLKEGNKLHHNNPHSEDHQLTSDEVRQLQKELTALVSNCDLDNPALVLEESNNGDDQEESDQHKQYSATVASNSNNAISKKSVSFLLKKMFVCGAGFGPKPSLRDPTLSPPQTRMEKILRALLQKKIYPQNPSQPTSKKRYLASRHVECANNNDDNVDDDDEYDSDHESEGCKWVKTDDEYIVLEI